MKASRTRSSLVSGYRVVLVPVPVPVAVCVKVVVPVVVPVHVAVAVAEPVLVLVPVVVDDPDPVEVDEPVPEPVDVEDPVPEPVEVPEPEPEPVEVEEPVSVLLDVSVPASSGDSTSVAVVDIVDVAASSGVDVGTFVSATHAASGINAPTSTLRESNARTTARGGDESSMAALLGGG